jgi:glycosyltransferase involved in cell wall biosynthesis
MKVAIIGTRGIPNNYGGFEQCAEYLALGLVERGIDTTVYSWHDHPYKEKTWRGVNIVHCYSPVNRIGEVGEFIYDFNCILNTRKHGFDVILQLGYTSNSVWWWLFPKKSVITTNMDGFEWQRTRRPKHVRNFIRYSESIAARHSHHLVADSIGIQQYLTNTYKRDSVYIPYGAFIFDKPDKEVLNQYGLIPGEYDMLIARIFPENSIEMILDGVVLSGKQRKFLVIGGTETEYGQYLLGKFGHIPNIQFLGGVYDINVLNNLRYFSNLYFHGHTVGGTNPSLLEAMASNALICANENIYNSAILGKDAYYFQSAEEVASLILKINKAELNIMLSANTEKIRSKYSWDIVTDQYLEHFEQISGTIKMVKKYLHLVG